MIVERCIHIKLSKVSARNKARDGECGKRSQI